MVQLCMYVNAFYFTIHEGEYSLASGLHVHSQLYGVHMGQPLINASL